jgi:hypothetical protein
VVLRRFWPPFVDRGAFFPPFAVWWQELGVLAARGSRSTRVC